MTLNQGREKVLSCFKIKAKGIILNQKPSHTSQINSTEGIQNRTLINKVRCLLFDLNLEKEIWCKALLKAAYILKSPTSAMDSTAAEKLYQRKPK